MWFRVKAGLGEKDGGEFCYPTSGASRGCGILTAHVGTAAAAEAHWLCALATAVRPAAMRMARSFIFGFSLNAWSRSGVRVTWWRRAAGG